MKKRILITGATGFVGSVLARKLIKEGHEVHSFQRHETNAWRLDDICNDFKAIYDLDLRDEQLVNIFVKHVKPEIIYHFAANQACSSIESLENDITTNIIGTKNLLKALSKFDYELFVNAGSSSEYGDKTSPMKENDHLVPNSYHSFSKCAQTLLCQSCAIAEKKPIVTLRLFSVYGPYERKTRLIPAVINGCLNKEEINLSHPEVARDFIYVDDVVRACLNVAPLIKQAEKFSGMVFNIGTGIQSNIGQVVNYVSALCKKQIKCNWDKDGRSWDTNHWVCNPHRSRMLLGFYANTSLRDGLEKTIKWVDSGGYC